MEGKHNLVIFERCAIYPNIEVTKDKQDAKKNMDNWSILPINPDYIIKSYSNIRLKDGY